MGIFINPAPYLRAANSLVNPMNTGVGTLMRWAVKYAGLHVEACRTLSPKPVVDANFKLARKLLAPVTNRVVPLLSGRYNPARRYERILFIESTNDEDGWGVGDGIFKTPMISDIKRYLGAEIDIFTGTNRRFLFENNPGVREVYSPEKQTTLRVFLSGLFVRKNSYDLVISLSAGNRMHLLKMLMGIKTPYVHIPMGINTFRDENRIDYNRRMTAEALGYSVNLKENGLMRLYTDRHLKGWARDFLGGNRGKSSVGIIVGARNALKHFYRWAEVIEKLRAKKPATKIVLFGSKDALEESRKILAGLKETDGVLNCVGETDLCELFALMNEMEICVGVDGGPANAAIALGKKVLVIFNIEHADLILPLNANNFHVLTAPCSANDRRCLFHNMASRCLITGQNSETHDKEPPCLKAVSPDEIVEATLRLQNTNNNYPPH